MFQLKENEEIEIVFQWFQVQCKMGKLHETCKSNEELIETKTYEVHQLKCMLVVLLIWGLG